MAPLRRVLGIVVILLGIVLVVLPFAGVITTSGTVPESPGVVALTPSIFGSGTLKITWSGGGPNTQVTVYSCPGDTSCSNPGSIGSLTTLVQASGASGSLSASVTGGTTYLVTETGTTGGMTVTESVSGLALLAILGIVVAVVGVVLVALPVRKPATSGEETAPAAPSTPAVEETMLEAPTSAAEPMFHNEPSPTASSVPADEGETYGSEPVASTAVPAGGSQRPNQKCPNCGTMNEPWITNCRWCKRSLSSTG